MENQKILARNSEEYSELLRFLGTRGYKWLSGQEANNPPPFFCVRIMI